MDMCSPILNDDMGIPQRSFHMDITIDGQAVAVGGCLSLHLHISASFSQSPAADGKDGKDAEKEDNAVSDEAETAAVHATQCSVDGVGYQEKVRYTQMGGRWSM